MRRVWLSTAFLVLTICLGSRAAFADYNPTLGRWMEEDPIGYSNNVQSGDVGDSAADASRINGHYRPSSGDSLALYLYESSNPAVMQDPLGLCPKVCDEDGSYITDHFYADPPDKGANSPCNLLAREMTLELDQAWRAILASLSCDRLPNCCKHIFSHMEDE